MAGSSPPTRDDATTPRRNASRTVDRLSASRNGSEREGQADRDERARGSTSRRGRSRPDGGGGHPGRVRPARSWDTTCTSMSPESRTMCVGGAGPQGGAQPTASGGADHDLGAVDRAGEVEDGRGDVLPDDGVEGAAEILGELAQPGDDVRARTDGAVAADDVDGGKGAARAATGDQGAAAQQGVPSGPPVRATTMRVRAAHVSWMPCSARYFSRPSSTRSASHSSASSRSAVRLPARK